MTDIRILTSVVTHAVRACIAGLAPCPRTPAGRRGNDRGAVSLEQVLWFVAAGVSVAVVAAILWGQIRAEANTPINAPTAP